MSRITKRDIKFFNYARKIAEKANYKRTKVGCIAVLNNTIISFGFNSEKTHPLQLSYNRFRNFENDDSIPKIHAEINCLSHIKDSNIEWKHVKLYIYRKCKSREYGISRPCSACMKFIKDLGIRHIYYTTDQGYAYELIDRK